MPFTVICGTFHLVGKTSSGKDSGFSPDGDSIQFKPANPGLLDLNPVPYVLRDGIRVQPPCERDKTPGFILSRALEAHGRPVAFAFKGQPPKPDGSEVFLKAGLLRKSLNYQALAGGHAYPPYYDTLFAELRTAFTAAASSARDADKGIWAHDVSTKGLDIGTQADLERDGVVFPKLFRRLTEYLKDHPNDPAGFPGCSTTSASRCSTPPLGTSPTSTTSSRPTPRRSRCCADPRSLCS